MNYLKKSKKGQGTTEYIVILALVILAVVAFWGQIKGALGLKVTQVTQNIGSAGN